MNRFLFLLLGAAAALSLLAGCGEDGADGDAADTTEERLSADEFRQELSRIDTDVSRAFDAVFETAGRLPENARVPERAKDAAVRAAEVERQAADRLAGLNPPEDAQAAVDGLAEEARAQADAIEEAAREEDLRVGELSDSFEQHNPERYLNELEELGYLPGNDADEGGGAPEQ